ncbi:MAG: carboxypeptidase-like regulatory domain-containing protein [Gammaproteobacteria bacterium]
MNVNRLGIAACLLSIAQAGTAQPDSSSLTGRITGPDGLAVGDAAVQAKDEAIGIDARTRSSATGHYDLSDLPTGTYVLTVRMPCCAFRSYTSEPISLNAGNAHQLDVSLAEGVSLNTLGDDPGVIAAEIRDRQIIPDLPLPRTADGRPDLTGMWLRSDDPYPVGAKPLPWAAEVARERRGRILEQPQALCLPSAPPGGGGFVKFVQTPELILYLFEGIPGYRQFFLDGREHPADPNPTWMGHAIGRWEKDTLVVDTIGFNTRGWLGTFPQTEMLRLEERYTRTDFGHMTVRVTIKDPSVFEEPWIKNMTWDFAPREELLEFVCENNKWAEPVFE